MPDSVIADGCLPVVNYDPAQPKQCKPPHIEEVTTKVNPDQGRSGNFPEEIRFRANGYQSEGIAK
ncbi:13072_t:CDS:2 [Rhizophagus irregularis]|nr:13072_t:CDS:2 [Rhizophagus irregularis]